MAGGWTNDDGVQEQILDSLKDEIERVRNNLPKGESLQFCEECGEEIPLARRQALSGVRLCIECQQETEKNEKRFSLFNRRGNKNSQLR